ncbi:MAG: hypothetical protein ACI3XR_05390 [Eubacteriales bacterium]
MIDKKDIIYTFDKSYSISYNSDFFCCIGESAKLFDIKTGAFEFKFSGMKHPYYSCFISDNRLVVKTTLGYYFVYDLVSKSLLNKLHPPKGVRGSNTEFVVTPDHKYIIDFAYIFPVSKLMFMEIETGKYTLYDLPSVATGRIFYDEAESEYHIISSRKNDDPETNNVNFYSFHYPYRESEQHKISLCHNNDFSAVDYRCTKIAICGYNNIICTYDMKTGIRKEFCYEKDGVTYDLKWSKNGKYIVLVEARKIRIFDVASQMCIKAFDVDYGCFADFYDDDSKLLIGTWEKGYCIDVSSL